ncbi:hypothetical protein GCM10009087_03990 [Sphingomonas oligophenolica]
MHVGNAAMERILDRDDRAIRPTVTHGIYRVGEIETGQGESVRERLERSDMGIGAGGALKGDGTIGMRGGLLDHPRHDRARGGGEIFHGKGALNDAPPDAQAQLAVRLYRI